VGKLIPRKYKSSLRKCIYPNNPPMSGIKEITSDGKIIREHVREYLPRELIKLFKESGFKIEDVLQGFLNVPACLFFDKFPALLTIWKKFDSLISKLSFSINFKAHFIISAKKPENKFLFDAQKILVVNLGGIGDILLSLPALRALRTLYPNSELSCLVALKAYEFTKYLRVFDNVNIFYSIRAKTNPIGLVKDLITLYCLRRGKIDLAINMRTIGSRLSAQKMKFLFLAICPKLKCGRDTENWGEFFDIKIPEKLKGEKSEMEYDMDTVKALGAEEFNKDIVLKIDEVEVDKLKLKLNIAKEEALIGLHIGGMPSRRWPLENFSRVISEFIKKFPCRFVIVGGVEERLLGEKLIKMVDGCAVNLCGKLRIEELIVLIKSCDLFVCNDSGPMHIAAALKIPLVALFGPGDLTRFDPRNIFEKAESLHKNVFCSPCEKYNCLDLKCLKNICVEEVISAMERQLAKRINR
jgi:ADP-heptose:LPS heptosyltransferase